MTDEQLEAMQQRAKALYPYGAAPEQMHRIVHQPDVFNNPDVANNVVANKNAWQDLWNRLGIEGYLDQSLK